MQPLKSQYIPLIALLITGTTSVWAAHELYYAHPFVPYRYAAAIVIIYAFFRFIAFSDKRRTAQLTEVGLLHPLRDSAFLVCTHAHLIELGTQLQWVSPQASIEIGLLSWASILFGYYAPQHPQGIPSRLLDQLPHLGPHNKSLFCKGLIISGCVGIVGTFMPTMQILWLLIPLLITTVYSHKVKK